MSSLTEETEETEASAYQQITSADQRALSSYRCEGAGTDCTNLVI